MAKKYFMNIQIKLFSAIGFDIDIASKTSLKFSPLLTLFTVGPMFLFVLPVFNFAIQNLTNLDQFTYVFSALLQGFLSVMKLTLFIYHNKKFAKLIARIRQLLTNETQHNKAYDDIVQQENRNDKILCLIYSSICYSTGISALLEPFIKMTLAYSQTGNTTLILPFPTLFPYNTQNLKNYIFTYLWAMLAAYCAFTGSIAVDTLFSSYTHNDALDLAEELRITFQPLIFAQLFFSSAQICVVVYQSGAKMHEPEIAYLFMFMLSALLQVIIVCYCGERLKSESEGFADAIYSGIWYEYEAKLARSLLIPLARAQRPCKLDGFFFVADMPTLSTILSTALSYITILKSFEE